MKLLAVPRVIANLIQLVFSVILVTLSLHLIHLAIGLSSILSKPGKRSRISSALSG
jgi:hypothetical protein